MAAGLLHDAVEDSDLTVVEVAEAFGRDVASIVDGVTKLSRVPYLSRQEQQAESFRKMLVAMSEDIRVLIVKLVDRLDNMRTLQHMPSEKQVRIAKETLQIYAPLAGRLGLDPVRRELQETGFSFVEPVRFAQVAETTQAFFRARPTAFDDAQAALRASFADASERPADSGFDWSREPDVPGRHVASRWPTAELGEVSIRGIRRTYFRVWHRLEDAQRGEVEQLDDVATFVVITQSRLACYAALGQLHAHFQPVPGRFRDHIALPRPNRYRALHTTVIDERGQRVDVQIRSQSMEAVAERGILAQMELDQSDRETTRLAWLRQLMDWQIDVTDPHEFLEAVKADLYADEIYVFSPKGDIYTFGKGATPIDFAFAIHSDVGMRCSGARVNGQLVPLRYRLRQGDTVEIVTNPTSLPRPEWLRMCVSSRARSRIKQVLRTQERERLRTLGRSLLEREVLERGAKLADLEELGAVVRHAASLQLAKDARGPDAVPDAVYEAIGAGQVSAAEFAERLLPSREGPASAAEQAASLLGRVFRRMRPGAVKDASALGKPRAPLLLGHEHVDSARGEATVELATCCSPLPGDPLIGFFRPGQGIVAHVETCPAAFDNMTFERVHLGWQPGVHVERPVTVEVHTINAVGLLAELSRAFSLHGVNIKQANCRALSDGRRAVNTFHASVDDLDKLEGLMRTLKGIDGVVAVERVFEATPHELG